MFYFIKKFLDNPLLPIAHLTMRCSKWIKNDALYLRILFFCYHHKPLNLSEPKTFSEKIQWLKLYNHQPEYTMMVDKYAVKDYVSTIIGKEHIIPTLGCWEKFDDIDFDRLPEKFVLKTTHDSGSAVICTDKGRLNQQEAHRKLSKSLNYNYFLEGREWPYKNVHARIIAEKYVDALGGDLCDYKIWCFNGEPKYCQVISNRAIEESIDFYDLDWNHLNFQEPKEYPHSKIGIQKPLNLDVMIKYATLLAESIPFIRVDFYNIDGVIYFGELTFFPTGGLGRFSSEEWNKKMGEMIKLPTD